MTHPPSQLFVPQKLAQTPSQLSGRGAMAARPPLKPSRWAWVEVPLAQYSDGGLKKVRLITDQRGFAIAYAMVSSIREEAPTGAETRVIEESDPEGAPGDAAKPWDWLLMGPFQNRGFGSTESPEEELDWTAPLQTKAGAKEWAFEVARMGPAGAGEAAVLDFTKIFNPAEDVAAFAMIHAWSPDEIDAVLLLGSDDGAKVWLNADLVHAVDRARGLQLDEDRAEIRLKAGWNRFLLKVYQGKGGWGLAFRLTDRQGKELPALRYDAHGNLPGRARTR